MRVLDINKIKGLLNVSFLTLTMLMLGSMAQANISEVFTPTEKDISLGILSQLFGQLVNLAGWHSYHGDVYLGYGLDPFQNVLSFFNYICLVIAGMIWTFSLFIGMVNTAQEGIFLGKEMGNPFFFIRNVVAIGVVIPFFSGYCALQVGIMWIVVQSIGLGSTMWQAFLNITSAHVGIGEAWLTKTFGTFGEPNMGGSKGTFYDLYSLKAPNPEVSKLVYKTFEGYVCMYGVASQGLQQDFNTAFANNKMGKIKNEAALSVEGDISNQKSGVNLDLPLNAMSIDDNGVQSFETNYQQTDPNVRIEKEKAANKLASQRATENEKAAWNETRNQIVNPTLLHSKMVEMFGIADNNVKKNSIFYFGVGTKNAANADGTVSVQGANGGQYNTSCGYIDFSKSNNSHGSSKLYDNVNSSLKQYAKISGKSDDIAKIDQAARDHANTVNKNRAVDAQTNNTVLSVYADLMNGGLRANIEQIARNYVQTVNELARFPEYTDTAPAVAVDAAKRADIKQSALANAAKQLDEEYHRLEQAVIKEVYKKLEESYKHDYEKTMNGKGYDYQHIKDMRDKAGNYVNFMKIAENSAKEDGWAMAGTFYMTMVQSVNKIHNLTSITPALGFAEYSDGKFSQFLGNVEGAYKNGDTLNSMLRYYGFYDEHIKYSDSPVLAQEGARNVDTANSIAALAMGLDVNKLYAEQRHPVIILSEAGHNLMSAAEKLMQHSSYWQTRKSPKGDAKNKGFIDQNNPATQLNGMMTYVIGAILVLGFMMAFYLPVLPLLIWLGAIAGWLVSVVEAIFIAPLWGIMHLHPEGNKYTGKGSAGYSMLLSLALKPSLLILGLCASLVLVQVFGIFINYAYGVGMMMSLDGDMYDPNSMTLTKFAYIYSLYFTYAIFMNGMVTKLFNLITIIPDHMLKWIGSQQGNLSEYGAIGGAETHGKLSSLATPTGNVFARKFESSGENAGQADHNAMQAKFNAENPNMKPEDKGAAFAKQYGSTSGSGYMAMQENSSGIGEMNNPSENMSARTNEGEYERRPYNPNYAGSNSVEPKSMVEKDQYNRTYDNAYGMAQQAGMNETSSHDYAQRAASKGHNNEAFRETARSWNNNNVMERFGSAENAQDVLNRSLEADNGRGMAQSLINDGKEAGVSRNNRVATEYSQSPKTLASSHTPNVSQAQDIQVPTQAQAPQVQAQTTPVTTVQANSTSASSVTPNAQVAHAPSVASGHVESGGGSISTASTASGGSTVSSASSTNAGVSGSTVSYAQSGSGSVSAGSSTTQTVAHAGSSNTSHFGNTTQSGSTEMIGGTGQDTRQTTVTRNEVASPDFSSQPVSQSTPVTSQSAPVQPTAQTQTQTVSVSQPAPVAERPQNVESMSSSQPIASRESEGNKKV